MTTRNSLDSENIWVWEYLKFLILKTCSLVLSITNLSKEHTLLPTDSFSQSYQTVLPIETLKAHGGCIQASVESLHFSKDPRWFLQHFLEWYLAECLSRTVKLCSLHSFCCSDQWSHSFTFPFWHLSWLLHRGQTAFYLVGRLVGFGNPAGSCRTNS